MNSIITRLGNLEKAFLIDDYAEGKDTGIIDLLLVGDIDQYHLNDLSRKTERYIKRKVTVHGSKVQGFKVPFSSTGYIWDAYLREKRQFR